jgi:hypothetical protein
MLTELEEKNGCHLKRNMDSYFFPSIYSVNCKIMIQDSGRYGTELSA